MNGTRSALLIAASEYDDAELSRLRWPAADVEALAEVLSNETIGGFEVHEPLVNQPSHIVKRRIESFLSGGTSEDIRLLYFSCHGVLSDKRRLYFAMPDTERTSLMSTAVDDFFVHSALEGSRAGSKVLILDCCHAGAFARGLPNKGSSERQIDVERLTGGGLVTLTASKEIEYAYEHGQFQELEGAAAGSIFTQIMVEGLRTGEADLNHDGEISVDELYQWIEERMRDVTTRQRPGHSSFGRHGSMLIGWTRRSRVPKEVRARLADTTSVHGRLWAIDRLKALRTDAEPEQIAEIDEALGQAVRDADPRVAASAEAVLAGETAPAAEPRRRDAPPPPSVKAASLIRRADEHRAARRFKPALDKYDEALRVSPGATNARVGRAHALVGLDRLDEALEALNATIEADPGHVWARVSRAELYLALDRPAAAQLDVKAALDSEDDSTEALTIHGRVLAALGHTEKAMEAYEQALEHDADHLDALIGLGEALAETGSATAALAAVDRAIALDDACVDARLLKAKLHYAADELRAGDTEVAAVLRVEPRNVRALLARGLAHLRREGGGTRDPLKDFDLALKIQPDHPGALFGRAVLLADSDPDEALKALQRVNPAKPATGSWRPAIADLRELEAGLLLQLGRSKRALIAAAAGLAEAPDAGALRLLHARANLALGRPEMALADLDHVGGGDDAAALRRLALGSLMRRPRDVWPAGVTEHDVAQVLHGDTLLSASVEGPRVDMMDLVRKLGPEDELLWYTACRYRHESFRRVALLLTSKHLVWAGRDEGRIAWKDVRDVRPLPPSGMRLVLRSGRRLEFPGIADQGVALSDEHWRLDADGVRELVARLAHDAT